MTKVYLEADGDRYTLDARDHATGSPEMCAAISAIVFAIGGWLANDIPGVEVISNTLEMGRARLEFRGGEACRAVFDLACIGFLQLQQKDPERISVQCAQIS